MDARRNMMRHMFLPVADRVPIVSGKDGLMHLGPRNGPGHRLLRTRTDIVQRLSQTANHRGKWPGAGVAPLSSSTLLQPRVAQCAIGTDPGQRIVAAGHIVHLQRQSAGLGRIELNGPLLAHLATAIHQL